MSTSSAAQPVAARPKHIPTDLVFDFDIYGDSRFTQNVQESYVEALKSAPDIFWTPRNGGHWMVRRYDAIDAIVKETEVFSAREMQIPRVPNPLILIPLNMDPPENVPFRQAMMPWFSPKAVRDMEPRMREWAARIVAEVADRGECDFIRDVSSLFPVSVFMELMGMPLERLREYRDLADEFFRAQGADALERAGAKISSVLLELIESRREKLGKDLVSHLLTADLGGRKFTADEVLRTCFLLFLGGMDTVTNVTGFTYQQLAEDPALQARLEAEPDRIPKFVEEGLRCYGVSSTPRLVRKDCERLGVRFAEGDMVVCLLPISGRDDRVNADPQRFDIDREEQPHLTFSTGPHLCIGHILARAEMRILTEEWLKRVPAFSVQPGVRRGFRTGTVIAIENLPLQWSVKSG